MTMTLVPAPTEPSTTSPDGSPTMHWPLARVAELLGYRLQPIGRFPWEPEPQYETPAPHRVRETNTLPCEAVALVALVINTVWKDCDDAEPAVDAAFADLIAGLSAVLPECWERRMFNLLCTEGIEF